MILQQCTKDFQSLINQWNVMKTYEHLEEAGQRCGWSNYCGIVVLQIYNFNLNIVISAVIITRFISSLAFKGVSLGKLLINL